MIRISPLPMNCTTPIDGINLSNDNMQKNTKLKILQDILVKEYSYMSEASYWETTQNQRANSANSIMPVIASATLIRPISEKLVCWLSPTFLPPTYMLNMWEILLR